MPSAQGLSDRKRAGRKAASRAQTRYEKRLTQSWQYGLDITNSGGGGLGLSNGAYRADSLQDSKQPVDNSQPGVTGLRVRISTLPGTVKFRVRGNTLNRKPNPDLERGVIRKLSRQALNRHLTHLRELEARGFSPEWMITLTYPGNWAEVLQDNALPHIWTIRRAWARLEELRAQATKVHEALRYNPNAFSLLLYLKEEMNAQRLIVREAVIQCRSIGPDGRKVKAHFNAFLKRFDRTHGTRAESVHGTYCQALQASLKLIQSRIYPDVKVRKQQAKVISEHGTYCNAVRAMQSVVDDIRYLERKGIAIKIRQTPTGAWQVALSEYFEVVVTLYRATWWLEFQRRGAPHIHVVFFDTAAGEINWDKVKNWAGHSWSATVAGLRSARHYSPHHNPRLQKVLTEYDQWREFWPKAAADGILADTLHEMGLDHNIFNHVRAGTRVEKMRKRHWGYAAKEAAKYQSKKYQATVPKNYQNVGRWWGYRKHQREKPQHLYVNIYQGPEQLKKNLLDPIKNAVETLPKGCYRFKKKLHRFLEAVSRGEDYGYITIWGQAAVEATVRSLKKYR